MTVKETAERLKVSTATVYALCESGRLAFARISTHAIRIAETDLAAYLGGCASRTRLRSVPDPVDDGRAQRRVQGEPLGLGPLLEQFPDRGREPD
ncbi:MAG: helix-turn-helix domain-containing protein [Anaeromyxobacter sp.]|nr:helix-turn-helix domain-containing protein [Anaeromyxobacter sp.]MBL0277239.1 helix-turn-helix domain-containing protein [Anaeromyxobacter sp.]